MTECQEEWIHMLAGVRDFELSLGLDTKRDYGEACNKAYRFGYEEARKEAEAKPKS